jgi:hypothetical protein
MGIERCDLLCFEKIRIRNACTGNCVGVCCVTEKMESILANCTSHIYHLVTARFNGWVQVPPPLTSNILPEVYISLLMRALEGC